MTYLQALASKLTDPAMRALFVPLVQFIETRLVPAGAIVPFGGSDVPDGYLPCDGRLVVRSQYPELFAAIRFGFGPVTDTSRFRLPDMRDKIPVGTRAGSQIGTDQGVYTVGTGRPNGVTVMFYIKV